MNEAQAFKMQAALVQTNYNYMQAVRLFRRTNPGAYVPSRHTFRR